MSDNPFKIGDKVKRKALTGTARDTWTVVGAWGEYIFVTFHPDDPEIAPAIRLAASYVKVEPFFKVGKTYQYRYALPGGARRRFRVEAVGGEGDGRAAFGEFKDSEATVPYWGMRRPEDFRFYDEVTE